MIDAYWWVLIAALLIGIVIACWVFVKGSRGAERREHRPDALDEGAEPARRNQALIDAPPAAFVPPGGTGTMAGVGEIVTVAGQDEASEAEERDRDVPKTAEDNGQAAPASSPDDVAIPDARPATPAREEEQQGDDLRKLKGVGPKLAAQLQTLGVTRYDQIAAFTEEDIDRIDAQLGSFQGRIRRDNWVEQARFLASGDTAGYEAKFGKL